MIDELNELLHPETLPLQKPGRRAHYEGSIDKTGGNADWDWHLYQDENKEWVLFEQYGAGCIYNFVQHRYIDSPEPTFRFYFDGETIPRLEIKPSQFGEKYPFIEPLAGKFIGPDAKDTHGESMVIRVVRSFVPMPFTSYCKVTSDIMLEGNTIPHGGWGHIVYHTYSHDKPVQSFCATDNRYRSLAQLWKQSGRNPLQVTEKARALSDSFILKGNSIKSVFQDHMAGLVTAIKVQTKNYAQEHLQNLWICAKWDGHEQNDLEVPWGCLFSNELGYHQVTYLYAGMDADGGYYCYFPMPYRHSAEISIENRGDSDVEIDYFCVESTPEHNEIYADDKFGYFMNTPYYPKKHTKGADSIISSISGTSGHVISSVVTGYPFCDGGRADCEGDARIHFDGIRTPQIESDGSESYSCYGWGFCSPPQFNPASGYDGKEFDVHRDWSMTRQLPGDCYLFYDSLHFAFESFGCNDGDMYHSGTVFYYGRKHSCMTFIQNFSAAEETMTSYFEGDDDDVAIELSGNRAKTITFSVPIDHASEIILRRVSDQGQGRQLATVYVDNVACAQPWYNPDHNPYKRWLEDEYIIPASHLQNKDTVTITIVPEEIEGKIAFNQFGIKVYKVSY